jgi:hypothetical protein
LTDLLVVTFKLFKERGPSQNTNKEFDQVIAQLTTLASDQLAKPLLIKQKSSLGHCDHETLVNYL